MSVGCRAVDSNWGGAGVDIDDRHLKTPLLLVLRDVLGMHGTRFGQFPMTAVHPHAQHAADREEQ